MKRAGAGQFGEKVAAAYLRKNGCRILEKGYSTRMGEIDIIAQQGDVYIFAEVKTRGENAIHAPREAVTAAKQRRLMAAAQSYVQYHCKQEVSMRFDVVEVYLREGQKPAVRHLPAAFEA